MQTKVTDADVLGLRETLAGSWPYGGGRALDEIAERHGATPARITLAWLLRRSPTMLPIPGTFSLEPLKENLAAVELEDVLRSERALTLAHVVREGIAGGRCPSRLGNARIEVGRYDQSIFVQPSPAQT